MVEKIGIEDTEYYNSVDQLLEEEDILEMDIRVVGWKNKLRIRALSVKDAEEINKNATKDGELDTELFMYWTLIKGLVRPKVFNLTVAKKFGDKNNEFVKELADEIWNIGRISKYQWDAYMLEIERANKITNKDFSNERQKSEEEEE